MLEDWDPDRLYDDGRRPPDEDDYESEPDGPTAEDYGYGEAADEAAEWLIPELAEPPAEPDGFAPVRRAVLVGAAAAMGAFAILFAVLRRRG